MDNNNFDRENQVSEKIEEGQISSNESMKMSEKESKKQFSDTNAPKGAYYNNGPRLPKSEATARPVNSASGGQAFVLNKEKMAIIVAMGALAIVLLSVVLLITFCGGASGHKHEYDYTLTKEDNSFVLVGKCKLNGCPRPNYVEKNVNAKLSDEIAASCSSVGKKVYSFEKDGTSYSYEEITGEATSHVINGVGIDEYRNKDGALKYMPPYISLFDANVTCGITKDGTYSCSVCNEIGKAKVYVDCESDGNWYDVLGKAPTCTTSGTQSQNCKYCNKQLVTKVADALGHKYSYFLYAESGKFVLKTTCLNSKCALSISEQIPLKDLALETQYSANCSSPAKKVYSYTRNGETVKVEVEEGTVTGEHMIGGKTIASLASEGGVFEYGKVAGLQLFGGLHPGEGKACGTIGKGYFVCDECEEVVPAKVKFPDHKCTEAVVTRNPTTTSKGYAEARCLNPWCKSNSGDDSEVILIQLDTVKIGENATLNTDGTCDYVYRDPIYKFDVIIKNLPVSNME